VNQKVATIIHTTNTQCVLYIKAGVASMAGAWFITGRCRRIKMPLGTEVGLDLAKQSACIALYYCDSKEPCMVDCLFNDAAK